MKGKKGKQILLQLFTVVLFLLVLSPFFIVVINSAKSSFEIITSPISMPKDWNQLFKNIHNIWTSPSIRYASSVYTSVIFLLPLAYSPVLCSNALPGRF